MSETRRAALCTSDRFEGVFGDTAMVHGSTQDRLWSVMQTMMQQE